MGVVPIADVFDGVDGLDLADVAAAEDLLQGGVELGVAQDVADDDDAAGLLSLLPEGDALVQIGGDGLFQEDVVALVQGLEGLGHMLAVLGGDNHDVGEFRLGEELLVAGKAHVFGDAVALAQEGELAGAAVGAGHDFHFLRVLGLEGGVGLQAAVSTAADGECYRFVHRFFLVPLFFWGRLPGKVSIANFGEIVYRFIFLPNRCLLIR